MPFKKLTEEQKRAIHSFLSIGKTPAWISDYLTKRGSTVSVYEVKRFQRRLEQKA